MNGPTRKRKTTRLQKPNHFVSSSQLRKLIVVTQVIFIFCAMDFLKSKTTVLTLSFFVRPG